MSRGRFITFEGTEGVGKSTQLAQAERTLTDLGVDVLVTREPGGTPLAEDIRALLLTPRDEAMNDLTELLLVFAARAQHLYGRILPAIESGRWVLCDRFTDATFAYQGGGRGLSADRIAQLEQLVQGDVRPDHVVLLDAPVDVGMARARHRGALDRFEQERAEFFQRVREAYHARAAAAPERYRRVDASRTLADVTRDVTSLLTSLVAESRST